MSGGLRSTLVSTDARTHVSTSIHAHKADERDLTDGTRPDDYRSPTVAVGADVISSQLVSDSNGIAPPMVRGSEMLIDNLHK
jgi:hypothetical protein